MSIENDYIEVTIKTGTDSGIKDILVALLSNIGFEGFEEERDLIKAFIPERYFDDSLLRSVTELYGAPFTTALLKHKNWNDVWEKGFDPVIIGNFCAVRAFFHPPVASVKYDLIITPKMSFGTAHHATTYMMIEALKELPVEGKSVFDFGTGTGILAILAEKMGASECEAIDIDKWSIENGKENLLQNQCSKVLLYQSNELPSSKQFDIILANINRNTILEQMGSIRSHLRSQGLVVLSGLLTGDEAAVSEAASHCNLSFLSKADSKGWSCMQFINKQD